MFVANAGEYVYAYTLILGIEQVLRNMSEDLSMLQLKQKHHQKDAKGIWIFQRALFF